MTQPVPLFAARTRLGPDGFVGSFFGGVTMSTITYGALTRARISAQSLRSRDSEPPGLRTILDGLAAFVPAEAIVAHGVIVGFATTTAEGVTRIVNSNALAFGFWGLVSVSALLYVIGRGTKNWTWLDVIRMLIPTVSFVVWTMLQRATAFDAVAGDMDQVLRSVVAIVIAIPLIALGGVLANAADAGSPPNE